MIVFYGDGSTFEGDPKDAPRLNVQAVLTKDHSTPAYNVRWLVLHEWDYYIYGKGRWYGVNGSADLVDHVLFEDVEVVLKGRMIPDAEYQVILERAHNAAKGKTVHRRIERGR